MVPNCTQLYPIVPIGKQWYHTSYLTKPLHLKAWLCHSDSQSWLASWQISNLTQWNPNVPNVTEWFPIIPEGTQWYSRIPDGTTWYPMVLIIYIGKMKQVSGKTLNFSCTHLTIRIMMLYWYQWQEKIKIEVKDHLVTVSSLSHSVSQSLSQSLSHAISLPLGSWLIPT